MDSEYLEDYVRTRSHACYLLSNSRKIKKIKSEYYKQQTALLQFFCLMMILNGRVALQFRKPQW